MASERYEDLGGRVPEMSEASRRAMGLIGLGSKAMQAEVKAEDDIRQRAINKSGAEAYRNSGRERDRLKGIDVNSVEYLAKERLAERNRNRRA